MKTNFYILFIIILFTFSLCKINPRKVEEVYSFKFNNPYEIFKNSSEEDSLAPGTYYGKLEVHKEDQIDMQFKVLNKAVINFDISVTFFSYEPSNDEIINCKVWESYRAIKSNSSSYNYDIYNLPSKINTTSNIYIGMKIFTDNSLSYLSFLAFSKYYSYIKDLDYNINYYPDPDLFPNRNFPNEYNFYFRTKTNNTKEKVKIQIYGPKSNETRPFKIDICQYNTYPSNENVFFENISEIIKCKEMDIKKDETSDSLYNIYTAYLQTDQNINYLGIHLGYYIHEKNILGITLYPEEGQYSSGNIFRVKISLLFAIILMFLF